MRSAATGCRWSRPTRTSSPRSAPASSGPACSPRPPRSGRPARSTCPSGTCPGVRHLDRANSDRKRRDKRPSVCGRGPRGPGRCQTPAMLGSAMASLDSRPMGACRIIPLGGLGEVGKNMTVYEADGSIVIVDAGLAFPRDEHLGVDLLLPDFSYLREREGSVRAVVLTHGHEDHVGALPYLMREVRVPLVIATRLTLALVKSKLDEHGLLRSAELQELAPGDDPVEVGPFRLEFIRMAHSIPDAAAVVLETPGGRCVHTGDYKLDPPPVDGKRTDVGG